MSTWRVLRWIVPVDDKEHLIGAGQVLNVAARVMAEVEVWTYELVTDGPVEASRVVRVFGTGQPLPPEHRHHLGSTFDGGSPDLVWHLFTIDREATP